MVIPRLLVALIVALTVAFGSFAISPLSFAETTAGSAGGAAFAQVESSGADHENSDHADRSAVLLERLQGEGAIAGTPTLTPLGPELAPHAYDDRADVARPPPVGTAESAYDTSISFADPAADGNGVRRVSSG